MAAAVMLLAFLASIAQPGAAANWTGASGVLPYTPQGDKPYCLLYSAASVLNYWLPQGNENGAFTPGRLVDDYKNWFDPGWQEGTAANPVRLYDGIHRYYGMDVIPITRYDLDTTLAYVKRGYPAVIYLKIMTIGDQVYTDAFVAYGVSNDSDQVFLVSSAYGYRSLSTSEIANQWDGWGTVIKPATATGDHGVNHIAQDSAATSLEGPPHSLLGRTR